MEKREAFGGISPKCPSFRSLKKFPRQLGDARQTWIVRNKMPSAFQVLPGGGHPGLAGPGHFMFWGDFSKRAIIPNLEKIPSSNRQMGDRWTWIGRNEWPSALPSSVRGRASWPHRPRTRHFLICGVSPNGKNSKLEKNSLID